MNDAYWMYACMLIHNWACTKVYKPKILAISFHIVINNDTEMGFKLQNLAEMNCYSRAVGCFLLLFLKTQLKN